MCSGQSGPQHCAAGGTVWFFHFRSLLLFPIVLSITVLTKKKHVHFTITPSTLRGPPLPWGPASCPASCSHRCGIVTASDAMGLRRFADEETGSGCEGSRPRSHAELAAGPGPTARAHVLPARALLPWVPRLSPRVRETALDLMTVLTRSGRCEPAAVPAPYFSMHALFFLRSTEYSIWYPTFFS